MLPTKNTFSTGVTIPGSVWIMVVLRFWAAWRAWTSSLLDACAGKRDPDRCISDLMQLHTKHVSAAVQATAVVGSSDQCSAVLVLWYSQGDGNMMFGFAIKSDGGETLTLYSPDRFLRDAWVSTINMATQARACNMYINDRWVPRPMYNTCTSPHRLVRTRTHTCIGAGVWRCTNKSITLLSDTTLYCTMFQALNMPDSLCQPKKLNVKWDTVHAPRCKNENGIYLVASYGVVRSDIALYLAHLCCQ